WKKPNLLVLDEPTNHLDMETREALTVALSSFEGALILVSHDRHLLRAAADQLWLVHDGRVEPFDGDLDQYAALVLASRRERPADDAGADASSASRGRRELRREEARQRQRLAQSRRPIQARLQKVEHELEQQSARLRELDARLAHPGFYHGGEAGEVDSTLKLRAEIASEVERLENRWLELQAELESTE
ncbi:MAG TPA: ABC transporter, partial [Burkholderiaceae bacterium]